MSLHTLLQGRQVVAIVDNQFGDSGKGKFSDLLAKEWADITARGTGGDNAGHTVDIKGKKRIFHILPVGIAYDNQGKNTLLGQGMVIAPQPLCTELDMLKAEGLSYNNLLVSSQAHMILPFHVEMDSGDKSAKNGGIGTTGKGIGPAYGDRTLRIGVRMKDGLDIDVFARKVTALRNKRYPNSSFSVDDVVQSLEPYLNRIRPFVVDTEKYIKNFLAEGKRVCIEGAQGLMLSIDYGTYPYVTSSDCSIHGTAAGVGLSSSEVDLTIGIIKFPYMTRVGGGPFPTEMGGTRSEKHCNGEDTVEAATARDELTMFSIPFTEEGKKVHYDTHHPRIMELMNSDNEFERGVGIRLAGDEYGATTQRCRRVGWTDGVIQQYARRINGKHVLAITKSDVLEGVKNFKICQSYENADDKACGFNKDEEFLRQVQPNYSASYGPIEGVAHSRDESAHSPGFKKAINDFEKLTNTPIAIISTGSEQQDVIFR